MSRRLHLYIAYIFIAILLSLNTAFGKALPQDTSSQTRSVEYNNSREPLDVASLAEERRALDDIQPYIVDSDANTDVRVYKARVGSEGAGYYKAPDVFAEQIGDIPARRELFVQPAAEKDWVSTEYLGEIGFLYADQVEINCESVLAFSYIQLGHYITRSAIEIRDDLKSFEAQGIRNLKIYVKDKSTWVEYRLVLGPYLGQTDLEKSTALLKQKNLGDYEIRTGLDDEPFFHQVSCENESIVEKKRNAIEDAKKQQRVKELKKQTAEKEKKNRLAAEKKRLEIDRKRKSEADVKRQKEVTRKKAVTDAESIRRLSGKWRGTIESTYSGLTGSVWLKIRPNSSGFSGNGESKIDRNSLLSLLIVNCFPTISITGTVNGSNLNAIGRGKHGAAKYIGKISGSRITGSYDVFSGKCEADKGTFTLTQE